MTPLLSQLRALAKGEPISGDLCRADDGKFESCGGGGGSSFESKPKFKDATDKYQGTKAADLSDINQNWETQSYSDPMTLRDAFARGELKEGTRYHDGGDLLYTVENGKLVPDKSVYVSYDYKAGKYVGTEMPPNKALNETPFYHRTEYPKDIADATDLKIGIKGTNFGPNEFKGVYFAQSPSEWGSADADVHKNLIEARLSISEKELISRHEAYKLWAQNKDSDTTIEKLLLSRGIKGVYLKDARGHMQDLAILDTSVIKGPLTKLYRVRDIVEAVRLSKASGPETRPSCLDCVEKHLGAALVLMAEKRDGYEYRLRIIGHLHEAEDESQEFNSLHDAIRDARKAWQEGGTVPDWEKLSEKLALLQKNCGQDADGKFGEGNTCGGRHEFSVGGSQKKFTMDAVSTNSGNYSMMEVDVETFDKSFAKDTNFYIDSKGSNEIGNRIPKFKKFLSENSEIEAPVVGLTETGEVSFINGRHRWAVLRDAGLKKMSVTVEKSNVRRMEAKFGRGLKKNCGIGPEGFEEGNTCGGGGGGRSVSLDYKTKMSKTDQTKWQKGLSKEDTEALNGYAAADHVQINARLRGDKKKLENMKRNGKLMDEKSTKDQTEKISKLIEKAGKFEKPVSVFKGTRSRKMYEKLKGQVGKTVTLNGFQSTSTRVAVADSFTRVGGAHIGTVIEIETDRGLYRGGFGPNKNEDEIILGHGWKYEVVSAGKMRIGEEERVYVKLRVKGK